MFYGLASNVFAFRYLLRNYILHGIIYVYTKPFVCMYICFLLDLFYHFMFFLFIIKYRRKSDYGGVFLITEKVVQ